MLQAASFSIPKLQPSADTPPVTPPSANAPGLISEHGKGGGFLPATVVKPPTKTKPAPHPNPPGGTTGSGTSDPNSFQSFLDALGLGTPTQPSQDEINKMVQSAIQPILDEYNNEIAKIQANDKQTQTFQNNAAMQLGDWLKALGGDNYTPTVAALLGQQTTRIQNYNEFNAQQNVWDSLIGGQNGINAQIPGIEDKIKAQYAGPSASDKISAFNAWQSYTDSQGKTATGNLAIAGAMMKQYAGSVPPPAIQGFLSQTVGYKPGTTIPLSYNGKTNTPKTGTWRTVAGGDGFYHLVNSLTGAQRPTNITVKKTAAGRPVSLQLRNVGGHVAYFNPTTGELQVTGLPYGSPKTTGKSLTTSALNTFLKSLTTTKTVTTRDPNTGTSTTKKVAGSFTMKFGQAYKRLIAMGATDVQARTALQSVYKRGQGGRAWLTNEEQAKLRSAGVRPSAFLYGGNVAFLVPAQAQALGGSVPPGLTEQSRVPGGPGLPPGYWTQGSTKTQDIGPIYVISVGF